MCPACADHDAAAVSPEVLALLAHLATTELSHAGLVLEVDERTRRRSRSLLFGFVEYHLERRMRSFALLARPSTATAHEPTLLPT